MTAKSAEPRQGFVYLIKMARYYKIGSSRNPAKRCRQFDNGPVAPKLVHTFPSKQALLLERTLQRRFREKRVRREWFILDQQEAALISSVLAADAPDDLPTALIPPPSDPRRSHRTGRSGRPLHVYLPDKLWATLDKLVKDSRRSLTTEVIIALEEHLRAEGLWPYDPSTAQAGN